VLGPFEGHTGYVRSVAFSPTGELVVSGSDDKTIRVWDTTTGRTVSSPFEGHTNYVMSVAFSPDGRHLVSGSADKRIRIWAMDPDQQVSGPSLSVNVTSDSPTEKDAVLGPVRENLWNAARSTLPCGFLLDHSNGWTTSQDSTIGSPAPLLFWAPPHHRRGICGSETVTIIETTLNKLDFCRFIHGPSWTQCYQTPVPRIRRSLSPLPLNALPQGDTPLLLLRTLGLVLLLVILSCVGGGAMALLARGTS
jgi:WD40 repeat protein